MNIVFPIPYTLGEWLAWGSALLTALFGLGALLSPRLVLQGLVAGAKPDHPAALAWTRSQVGGFYLGIGLAAMFLAQPLIYFSLGLAWGLAAFGRLVSMPLNDGINARNVGAFAVSALLSAFPLAYVLGFLR